MQIEQFATSSNHKPLQDKNPNLFIVMKKLILLLILIPAILSCRSGYIERDSSRQDNGYYTVSKIKHLKNNVYIIYAIRGDTTFKLFSHFDGKVKNTYRKLKKGSFFKGNLQSQFKAFDNKFNAMPNLGISILFHGVTISREPTHKINDIYSCEELNGRYIRYK